MFDKDEILKNVPPEKTDRVMAILNRWVKGEITTMQADRELQIAGVKLPKPSEGG